MLTVGQALLFFAYGCEPQTTSLLNDSRKVNRAELKNELELLMTQHQGRLDDLDRQQALRETLFQQTLLIAQGADPNPVSVVMSLLSILGIGASADNIRLRVQRKKTNGVVIVKDPEPA